MKLKHIVTAVLAGLVLHGLVRSAAAADFVSDTFAGRTAGTTLQSAVTPGSTGATWATSVFANNAIATATTPSQMRATNTQYAMYTASGTPASADYFVQADVTFRDSAGTGYLLGRAAGGATNTNYALAFGATGGQCYVNLNYNLNSGVSGNYLFPYTAGATHTIRLVIQGSALSVQVDGATVLTATDTHVTAAGFAGFAIAGNSTNTDASSDTIANFRASAIVAGINPGIISGAVVAPYANSLPHWSPASSTWSYPLTITTAAGGNGTYTHQWQVGTTSGSETSVSGATTATVTLSSLLPATPYFVRDSVNDTANTGAVNSADLSFTTPPAPANLLLLEGDSITSGYGQTAGSDIGTQVQAMLGPTWTVADVALSGDTLANINSGELSQVDSLYSGTYANKVEMTFAGTNDIALSSASGAGAAAYTATKTNAAGHKAVGFKAIVATILDRGNTINQTVPGFATEQATFNTSLRSNWATFADGMWDGQANALLSYTNAANTTSNTYLNSDQTHPTNMGGTLEAAGIVQAVKRLITPGGVAPSAVIYAGGGQLRRGR